MFVFSVIILLDPLGVLLDIEGCFWTLAQSSMAGAQMIKDERASWLFLKGPDCNYAKDILLGLSHCSHDSLAVFLGFSLENDSCLVIGYIFATLLLAGTHKKKPLYSSCILIQFSNLIEIKCLYFCLRTVWLFGL